MHSPIIYITTNHDALFDLTQSDEKEQFITEVYDDDLEDSFGTYVPESDYWSMDTTNGEGWHRGNWNVLSLIETEMERLTGRIPDLKEVKPGVYAYTIVLQDAENYQKYRANEFLKQADQINKVGSNNTNELRTTIDLAHFFVNKISSSSVKVVGKENEYDNVRTLNTYLSTVMFQREPITLYIYTTIQGDYHS